VSTGGLAGREPLLSVQGLDAFYGDLQALSDVSLSVFPGETVAIVGANAAGKSTLLRAISGLVRRTGRIALRGEDLGGLRPFQIVERGVVQVPEGRELFPFMTVEENLEIGAYPARARARRAESLREVFALLPRVEERRRQLASTLSGGEQQMCAIGRGMMARPELLMLDEPSLGLAPVIVQSVYRMLAEINAAGTTILLVEQNISGALRLAHRGYVLENGRVVLEGRSADLLSDARLRTAYMGL
jgi:branched-chain amino acid transport system ATP-binding protein